MADVDTTKITALRPFTDEEALAWLRERGKLTSSGAQLAKQFGWQERKAQRKLDDWRDAGLIKRNGKQITVIGATKSDIPSSAKADVSGSPKSDIKSDTPDTLDKAPPKRDGVAHPTGRATDVMAYVAAIGLATVGVGLSVVGMVETATYALAVGGVLFCAVAVAADVLTLTMPSVIGTLWRRRSLAVILAGLLWCAGAAVTVANLAGYVGEHVEQYQTGRETMATAHNMTFERLARLRNERKAIVETRPPGAITASFNDAPLA